MAITVKKSPAWTPGQKMTVSGTGGRFYIPATGGGGGGGGGGGTSPTVLPGGYTLTLKLSEGNPQTDLAPPKEFPWDPRPTPIWEIDTLPYESYPVYDGMTVYQDLSTRPFASMFSTGPVPVWPTGSAWRFEIYDLENNFISANDLETRNPDTGDYRPSILDWPSAGSYTMYIGDSELSVIDGVSNAYIVANFVVTGTSGGGGGGGGGGPF